MFINSLNKKALVFFLLVSFQYTNADEIVFKNQKLIENIKVKISLDSVTVQYRDSKTESFPKNQIKSIRLKPIIINNAVSEADKAANEKEKIRVSESLQNLSGIEIPQDQKLRIAVLNFKANKNIPKEEADLIVETITINLVKTKLFVIIDPVLVSKTLNEQGGEGCADNPTTCKIPANTIAKSLNVSKVLTGEVNGYFGETSSVGDFNGDGFTDLVVGSRAYNTNQGRAYIFHSSGSSGIPSNGALAANTILTGENTNDSFGMTFYNGDFNGDGFTDLVAGAFVYNSNIGRVYIFHSTGANGVLTQGAGTATTIIGGEPTYSSFGVNSSVGDFNGDGFPDLLVGASTYPSNTSIGRAYIFHSNGTSGITSTNAGSAKAILSGENIASNFGIWSAAIDANGDGFADFIIGGHIYNSNQGRSYLFQSTGSGGIVTTSAGSANAILTGETTSNAFGRFLHTADINGDGYIDLIISSLDYNSQAGRVYVFHSPGTTSYTTANANTANTLIDGESIGDKLK